MNKKCIVGIVLICIFVAVVIGFFIAYNNSSQVSQVATSTAQVSSNPQQTTQNANQGAQVQIGSGAKSPFVNFK